MLSFNRVNTGVDGGLVSLRALNHIAAIHTFAPGAAVNETVRFAFQCSMPELAMAMASVVRRMDESVAAVPESVGCMAEVVAGMARFPAAMDGL